MLQLNMTHIQLLVFFVCAILRKRTILGYSSLFKNNRSFFGGAGGLRSVSVFKTTGGNGTWYWWRLTSWVLILVSIWKIVTAVTLKIVWVWNKATWKDIATNVMLTSFRAPMFGQQEKKIHCRWTQPVWPSPSGRTRWSIRSRTSRNMNSIFPLAIRLMKTK